MITNTGGFKFFFSLFFFFNFHELLYSLLGSCESYLHFSPRAQRIVRPPIGKQERPQKRAIGAAELFSLFSQMKRNKGLLLPLNGYLRLNDRQTEKYIDTGAYSDRFITRTVIQSELYAIISHNPKPTLFPYEDYGICGVATRYHDEWPQREKKEEELVRTRFYSNGGSWIHGQTVTLIQGREPQRV